MDITERIVSKIDLFMSQSILLHFDPEQITWVFSVSGGKDSYTMCSGIKAWYDDRGLRLSACGVYIWQWNESLTNDLSERLPWLKITEIDARKETEAVARECGLCSKQAPCRECSDIRRDKTDQFISNLNLDRPAIICRGLHLSDMAISILWRNIWYGPDFGLAGKGAPFVDLAHVTQNTFLAKPLCFVREYESEVFAHTNHYNALVCDCPALCYPSRRDIVEESARLFYSGSLWEFDIPGVNSYLQTALSGKQTKIVKELSASGTEYKKPYIPSEYYQFAEDYFRKQLSGRITGKKRTSETLLESGAQEFFFEGKRTIGEEQSWTCKLLAAPNLITDFDRRMIGTLGPFWAAITLPHSSAKPFFAKQQELFGYTPDIKWSQVIDLLTVFYDKKV